MLYIALVDSKLGIYSIECISRSGWAESFYFQNIQEECKKSTIAFKKEQGTILPTHSLERLEGWISMQTAERNI